MTGKERMLAATLGKQADMVPVAPDTSNMIPCRLTGKPFWDIYLYRDPPLWKAYIDCAKHFDFDGWLPSAAGYCMGGPSEAENAKSVHRSDERIVTRQYRTENGKMLWSDRVTVYYRADPPTRNLKAELIGMAEAPERWWDIEGIKEHTPGREGFEEIRAYMGEQGIVGAGVGLPSLGIEPEGIYAYYDDRPAVRRRLEAAGEQTIRRAEQILEWEPDVLMIGISGYLTFHSPDIVRDIGLRTLQRLTKMAKDRGVPTHLHCCGRERALVEMAANETDLNLINPLEPPPMGDCDLAELKKTFGRKVALMGNIHTTDPMLRGTPEEVARAARWCIDVAAEGGGYVLSTGDQCGRDTPDENIFALVRTAREYGKY